MEIASFDVKRRFTETGGGLRWAVRSPWVRITPLGVPGTPYLIAWANSGKSGREQPLRLMAIRQARLEPLALSVSGRDRMFNGWAAAGGEKRIDFSRLLDNLHRIEGDRDF